MVRVLASALAIVGLTASLAGANDVVVIVKDGKLAITGDADGNRFVLDGTGLAANVTRITPSGVNTIN